MSRWLRIALGLCLVLGTYAGLHAYVAERLILAPQWPRAFSLPALAALVLCAASVPLRIVGRRRVGRWVAWLETPAYLWLGFGFLLLVTLAASDLVLAVAGGLARAAGSELGPPSDVSLRDAARLQAALAAAVAFAAGTWACVSANRGPRLERVRVGLRRWPASLDGLRIAQISDLHIGARLGRSFMADVVARLNALDADLIAITGDLADGSAEALASDVAPLAELRARHGVFFVTGNHDHYSGALSWTELLRSLGVAVLRNEHVVLERGGASFVLAGVDDHRGGFGGSTADLARALAGRDSALPVVLLAHDPNSFHEASHEGVDLQLSGHTHGGQIWPFRYAVRAATPWVAGLYRCGEAQIYVSRGTGFWGPPMRLFAPAELTELSLHRSPVH